ncbi:putative spermidine/putrescine transport system ATP-binding protein [Rhizobium subbaraonis]|uniref:Putative spermidine/putrescine transport system ATP-binding protein n=1 Tax=Rhizobium subbaraonis TaxID=908946 RepID=A0A285UW78_9HYPH|nr:ABC transporter ATP-binding protein [Rhizobium subbaraonis]SOC46079.1 putative spermidine/putrescine transport system ATP-binding protein [Rhizobium subbaraonis]
MLAKPDQANQPKLLVDGLAKSYGPAVALKPTHLAVEPGEFLTLLGPSGSGKTTLLQMVSGLVAPTQGRLFIDGRDETQTPVHKRDIGLVFQHYALFPHLTVAENIGFPLKMRGLSSADIQKQVAGALEMVQLGHLAGRFPRELSGGQQQRVALARCFVYKPAIILMDEPLGALDKKLREHMQFEIKDLHRKTGATIIYVTHDQEEALALSDRICLMNHARVEQIGPPHEIYARPRTAFAADFIGISNIFRGRVECGADGATHLATASGRLRIDGDNLANDAEMALVVRPEHIELGSAGENEVRGNVAEIVYAGSETRLLVEVAADERVTVRVLPGKPLPKLGENITLSWKPEAAVLVTP